MSKDTEELKKNNKKVDKTDKKVKKEMTNKSKIIKNVKPVKKTTENKKTSTTTKNSSSATKSKINKVDKIKKDTKNNLEKNEKSLSKSKNKSFQNIIIENIKNFISKIIDMQEKVRQDEQENKKTEKEEKEKLKEIEENEKNLNKNYVLEYYDLPYRYNETVVKILVQTPKRLFVYWDVSDKDKKTYLNAFGENFFNDTYPVLLMHNENKNYTREIPINDFANSWYLDINDPRDKYIIQLGRKFKSNVKPKINEEVTQNFDIKLNNDYLFIAMSNKMEVPNDHILFEEFSPYVKYRNVKTNKEEVRKITKVIYENQIKELYKNLYGEEIDTDLFEIKNPSSMGTSSSVLK